MIQTSMMSVNELPACIRRIPDAPKHLYIRGQQPAPDCLQELLARPRLAIVGTRRVTAYGQRVTHQFSHELAAMGVVIVSGLAIGVDAVAHRAALEAGGLTMAVLPGSVEQVYPASHRQLAEQIISSGGILASEYAAETIAYKTNFIARNRLVTGFADALLITEASVQSGTLHTARFALEQGTDVMVVPGNITSPTSEGTNNLIKSGAIPVTTTGDILQCLGLECHDQGSTANRIRGSNPQEQQIIDLLEKGISDGNQLLAASTLPVQLFNQHLTMLEITAKIRPLGANQWMLAA